MGLSGRHLSAARRKTAQRSLSSAVLKKMMQSGSGPASLLTPNAFELAQDLSGKSVRNKGQLRVLFNNQVINFNTKNDYIMQPEELWQLESIVGSQALKKALSSGQTVDNSFIEKLFRKASFALFLSSDKSYLVSSDDELSRLDFGPLTEISALDALQRFGIKAIEQAKEKTAVRV